MNTKTILIAIAVILLCSIAGGVSAIVYNQYKEKQQEQWSQQQMERQHDAENNAINKL